MKLKKPMKVDRSHDRHVTHRSPEIHTTSPRREMNIRHTPPPSSAARREQVVSSASKKRHASIFEVKTRQLVEEESQVFRQLHAKRLDFREADENEVTHPVRPQATAVEDQGI